MGHLDDQGAQPTGTPVVTRAAFTLTVALLAVLLVVAAQTDAAPTTARTGRRVELVELIRAEQTRTRALEARVAELAAEVESFERREAEGGQRLARLQRRIDAIVPETGLTAVRGPGVTAVLTDSRLATSPTGNLNDLVVHEQDLQAVINALWVGGAEAVTVNGQRILATTAIRCVGNTLLLHGGVYSPPYEIDAIGDVVALQAELDRDVAVQRFRDAANKNELGFTVDAADELVLPAYEGSTTLSVAQIAEEPAR